ncbi:metallophosphoesterase family protein [Lacunimicrobium album]
MTHGGDEMIENHVEGHVVEVCGCSLELLPGRAIYWGDAGALIVSDLHWGKEATFRHFGLALPDCLGEDLTRLSMLIERTGATRVLILGDLVHGKHVNEEGTLQKIDAWRANHATVSLQLVLGNHDRKVMRGFETRWGIDVHDELDEGPFRFQHHPEAVRGRYVVAGHLHPKFRLSAPGLGNHVMPGFLFSKEHAVLPAFSAFIDHQVMRPNLTDRVYVIAEGRVIEVSAAARKV